MSKPNAVIKKRSSIKSLMTKTTKPELMADNANKKSSKKRGVYVEKKSTITKFPMQGKPEPPRSRLSPKERNKRRHIKPKLDSSTSTISLKMKEPDQTSKKNIGRQHESPTRHLKTTQNDDITEYFDNLKEISRKNDNFRAKYLRHNMEDARPVSVLYSKRCLTQTPSQMSCRIFDEGRQEGRRESLRNLLERSLYGNISDIENAVLQGLEFTKNGENGFDPENKTSKDFYEYFTSLLDNSVQNYNTGIGFKPDSEKTSSSILIIDDTNIETDSIGKPSICPYVEKKEEPERFVSEAIESTDWNQSVLEYETPLKGKPAKNVVKKVTFVQQKYRNPVPLIRKMNQARPKEKKISKAKSFDKKTLLEILKEQIKTTKPIEQPRNMYQALQRIAKNREKSMKYDTKKVKTKFVDDKNCMTPIRRKLLPRSKSRENKNTKLYENRSFYKPQSILHKSVLNKNVDRQQSTLSLQVFEMDNNFWPTDGLIST